MTSTATTITIPSIPAMPRVIMDAFRHEPLFASTALCLTILMLPTCVAMGLDARTFQGANIWTKPLKFEFALSVYLLTLAWYARWLPQGISQKRWYKIYAIVVVTSIVGEMIWIGGAAALGTASHFNVSSPALAALYGLMGLFAVTLTTASLVYGVLIGRAAESPLDPVFRRSLAIGLLLTFVATTAVAGYMSGQAGHAVGGDVSDQSGSRLMGWLRNSGDLRVPHFFATHAMHAVPIFGFAASLRLPRLAGDAAVTAFGLGYAVLVAWTFAQALMGQPFLAGIL
jgi:hypothetical protein